MEEKGNLCCGGVINILLAMTGKSNLMAKLKLIGDATLTQCRTISFLFCVYHLIPGYEK